MQALPTLVGPSWQEEESVYQNLQKRLLNSEFTQTFVPGTHGETLSCPDKGWMELGKSSVPRPAIVRQQTQAKLQSCTTAPPSLLRSPVLSVCMWRFAQLWIPCWDCMNGAESSGRETAVLAPTQRPWNWVTPGRTLKLQTPSLNLR